MDIRNPFAIARFAERYAAVRPNVHRKVIEHVRGIIADDVPKRIGLDIGCGTGLSAVALAALAERVIAADVSRGMLANAATHSSVRYVQSAGEELPLPDESFDIATIACTFHWCDRDRLLAEVRRVLRPEGWLIVYDNGFMGPAEPFSEYANWHETVFHRRFPRAPRHRFFHPYFATMRGFRVVTSEFLQEDLSFTASQLAAYLMSMSHVIVAVECGSASIDDVERFLTDEISRLFESRLGSRQGETLGFSFGGYVSCLRKV